jgi:hypothetical protein
LLVFPSRYAVCSSSLGKKKKCREREGREGEEKERYKKYFTLELGKNDE